MVGTQQPAAHMWKLLRVPSLPTSKSNRLVSDLTVSSCARFRAASSLSFFDLVTPAIVDIEQQVISLESPQTVVVNFILMTSCIRVACKLVCL
jgi:hypothetical protein